ncbi:malto-oligosyltrehalose synthase [Mycobacteroides abscessus subsp. abscessus]|nr:malto-oligosyltrehalose synthase [Mycobacteroides abscessus subsp. abscessus]
MRVDHPDGLSYPAAYLTRLRQLIGPHRLLLVEKILANREPLDPTLPIDGTTGYDALAGVSRRSCGGWWPRSSATRPPNRSTPSR